MPRNKGFAIIIVTALLASGCEGPLGPSPAELGMTAAEQLATEYGADLDPGSIEKVVSLSKPFTVEKRAMGVDLFVAALTQELRARGKDASCLRDIHDMNLGEPLAGVAPYFSSNGEVASATKALANDDNPNKKYFECPVMGAKNGPDSCAQIIDATLVRVQQTTKPETFTFQAESNIQADQQLREQPQAFQQYSVSYLADLAQRVHSFGVNVAAIRAEYAMRDAGVCDDEELSGNEIAKLRGEEDGETILRQMIGRDGVQLAPQGDCVRIGPTGPALDAKLRTAVNKYVKDNPLCATADVSRDNVQVVSAEKARRDGIERAIKAHTTTIFVGVIRTDKHSGAVTKRGQHYTVVTTDACTPKDQVRHTTSPLVIDLDDDGLELTTDRVRFDLEANGKPQQVTWTGQREGLLTLDLDGDGQVTSGRELFGNRSDCAQGKCEDGAEALAQHDDNGDGRIDAKDRVFSRLRIWVDADQDGRSRTAELTTLAERGVKALSLAARYTDQRVVGGRISLTITVETERGPRTAYDVWFDNLMSPGFPTPLD